MRGYFLTVNFFCNKDPFQGCACAKNHLPHSNYTPTQKLCPIKARNRIEILAQTKKVEISLNRHDLKIFSGFYVFSHYAQFVYLYYFGFDVNCNSVFANERLSSSWGLKNFHLSFGENRKANWFFPHIRKCVIARFAKWNISMMWINYLCKISCM